MANKVQVKRSAVAGKVPTTTDLDLGELAVNTYDGKLFLKKNVGGVETIVYVTASASDNLIPTGTKMLFVQTAAPTGWTKDTTHNDKALRVVSGTVGSGGSRSFSSTFSSALRGTSSETSTGSVDSTTLSISQIPNHMHGRHGLMINNTAAFTINDFSGDHVAVTDFSNFGFNAPNDSRAFVDMSVGGNGSHTHGLVMNSHAHSIDMSVQYVDVIIATKD